MRWWDLKILPTQISTPYINQADRRRYASFSVLDCSSQFQATGDLSTVFLRQLVKRGEKGNLNLIKCRELVGKSLSVEEFLSRCLSADTSE